jgi:transcriptional regulator with GAF, ATPase, and Fis domain
VIAATHRDLAAMVREGGFREDLWYRIAVFPILIPPLRDRLEDIPALAQHFARRASLKLGLHPQPPTESDIALLSSYAWPGNVREMASVIERAAILGEGHRLEIATALGLSSQPRRASERSSGGQGEFATLDQAMIEHIHAALTRTRGKIEGPRGAARLLGINPYTLRSRMRKLGVDPRPFREL